jgi:hypothetical protein
MVLPLLLLDGSVVVQVVSGTTIDLFTVGSQRWPPSFTFFTHHREMNVTVSGFLVARGHCMLLNPESEMRMTRLLKSQVA